MPETKASVPSTLADGAGDDVVAQRVDRAADSVVGAVALIGTSTAATRWSALTVTSAGAFIVPVATAWRSRSLIAAGSAGS